jgi:hypothetical protein
MGMKKKKNEKDKRNGYGNCSGLGLELAQSIFCSTYGA